MKIAIASTLLLACLSVSFASQASGKLLGTPGVSQVEGAAGGGLVPWAQLAGYATEDEWAISGFCTKADVDDFSLNVCGAQANFFDRLELSYAEQDFKVNPLNTELSQSITGAKVRLYGDLVYSQWPQLTFGVQYKKLDTPAVANALGAADTSGYDYYLSASKLHLGAAFGYNLLWNATVRSTSANEMGLLGFGSANHDRSVQLELSSAVLLSQHLAVGVEYRQKPDNLGLQESDWRDVFVAWFPNKHVSVTAAYIDLGAIAALPKQTGWYLSVTGYF